MRFWKSPIAVVAIAGAAGVALAQESVHPPAVRAPSDYQGDHLVRVGATEFAPDDAATTYKSTWNPEEGVHDYRRYWNGGGYPHFLAWVHAPGGAALDYIEFDWCDTNPTYDMTMNVYPCDYTGQCDPSILTMASGGGPSCGYTGTTLASPPTVDNLAEILLDVTVPTAAPGDTLQIGGAVIGWKSQVSLPPDQPTFNDVPSSHPFYQFIEALNASGITAGCQVNPPLYCPNSPITRGQMAVFLAKALGLSWGGY